MVAIIRTTIVPSTNMTDLSWHEFRIWLAAVTQSHKYDWLPTWQNTTGGGNLVTAAPGTKSQWMNGALCRNNSSVSYFQNMFSAFGVSPQTSAGVPFLDPCSATPTFPSTPPWGISCGRPCLVNILSSSYKFILIGRFFEKKIVRKILDLCVEID